ncbi:MAG: response regulator, partial [Bryobacteraceae bacterium]
TGLGLAISAKLVALMGGRIWVESPWRAPWRTDGGPGSAFHFTAQFRAAQESAAAIDPALVNQLAVLVIDDNKTNRYLLNEMLSRWGMKPQCVASGAAGLAAMAEAKWRQMPFPLVLLDYQMPEMDGFETAERIRRNPDFAATRIVMLTSACARGDAARCSELGIQSRLLKPAKPSDLFEAICRAMAAEPASPMQAQPRQPPSLAASHAGLKILVAEDNPVNQKLALRLLERLGHSVVLAKNGREAIDKFERDAFDVVLMDVQMPELDGLEAAAAIREREKLTGVRTPIFALTAYAMTGDRERCLAAGMDGYLSKPIQSQELSNLLEAVV